MGTDPIEDFWIDGGGSDSELQYALDGFRDMVPTVGVGNEEPCRDLRSLEQNSSRKRSIFCSLPDNSGELAESMDSGFGYVVR